MSKTFRSRKKSFILRYGKYYQRENESGEYKLQLYYTDSGKVHKCKCQYCQPKHIKLNIQLDREFNNERRC